MAFGKLMLSRASSEASRCAAPPSIGLVSFRTGLLSGSLAGRTTRPDPTFCGRGSPHSTAPPAPSVSNSASDSQAWASSVLPRAFGRGVGNGRWWARTEGGAVMRMSVSDQTSPLRRSVG